LSKSGSILNGIPIFMSVYSYIMDYIDIVESVVLFYTPKEYAIK